MRERYPSTLRTAALMAAIAIFVALSLLWPPSAWIIVGAVWGWLLLYSFRQDRKRRRK